MCNDYGTRISIEDLETTLGKLQIKLAAKHSNMQKREDIRPTESAPIIYSGDKGILLEEMRWGFPPPRPKAQAVINFRSEGRTFKKGRCLIPASHFFEFTGAKYPKSKWRFTKADADWFCIAGLWSHADFKDGKHNSFTMLTTAPGPDIEPIHNRQIVILEPQDYAAWLTSAEPVGEMLKPLPAGSLTVEQVR